MSETYIAFGDPIEGHPPDGLWVAAAREAWRAIQARREFTFIEARRVAFVGAPPRPLSSTAITMRCRPGIGPTSAIASGLHCCFSAVPSGGLGAVGEPGPAHLGGGSHVMRRQNAADLDRRILLKS